MVICHPNIYVLMSTQCASPTPCEQSMATTETPESEPCLIPASPIKTISRSPLQLWLSFDYLVPSNSLSGTTSSDQPIPLGEYWVAETFPLQFVPRLPTYQVEAKSHRIESEALSCSSIWSTNLLLLYPSLKLIALLCAWSRPFSHSKFQPLENKSKQQARGLILALPLDHDYATSHHNLDTDPSLPPYNN